jgi:hypothetical protein
LTGQPRAAADTVLAFAPDTGRACPAAAPADSAAALRRTGFTDVAEEALRVLPDPVEGDQIGAFLAPYSITLDEIVSRMGGTT